MKREKRKVKECYLLLAPFNEKLALSRPSTGFEIVGLNLARFPACDFEKSWFVVLISFKNEDKGGAPPKEGGRDRSQLCSNRVPPTLELEKKTEDAEELPTQCGSDGKRKETPGGRPVHGYV